MRGSGACAHPNTNGVEPARLPDYVAESTAAALPAPPAATYVAIPPSTGPTRVSVGMRLAVLCPHPPPAAGRRPRQRAAVRAAAPDPTEPGPAISVANAQGLATSTPGLPPTQLPPTPLVAQPRAAQPPPDLPQGPHCLLPGASDVVYTHVTAGTGFPVPVGYVPPAVRPRKGWRSRWAPPQGLGKKAGMEEEDSRAMPEPAGGLSCTEPDGGGPAAALPARPSARAPVPYVPVPLAPVAVVYRASPFRTQAARDAATAGVGGVDVVVFEDGAACRAPLARAALEAALAAHPEAAHLGVCVRCASIGAPAPGDDRVVAAAERAGLTLPPPLPSRSADAAQAVVGADLALIMDRYDGEEARGWERCGGVGWRARAAQGSGDGGAGHSRGRLRVLLAVVSAPTRPH